MKIRNRLEKSTRFLRTDVFFAFLRHEINRTDLDENMYWNLWPFAANFFELSLTITTNGAVSKTLLLRLKNAVGPNATFVTISMHV